MRERPEQLGGGIVDISLPKECMPYFLEDLRYYQDRLDDPSLLEKALPVMVEEGYGGLAVPLGGRRRLGLLILDCSAKSFRKILELLSSRPGFSPLRSRRLRRGSYEIEWGDGRVASGSWGSLGKQLARNPHRQYSAHQELLKIKKTGRSYGYSDKAIQEEVDRQRALQEKVNRAFALRDK